MNYAEKMEMECRLLGNIADWMVKHGEVLADRKHSNAFCGMRIREVIWRDSTTTSSRWTGSISCS